MVIEYSDLYLQNQEKEVKRRDELIEAFSQNERDKIRKINLISKGGGTSMIFGKRSSEFNSRKGSRLPSEVRRQKEGLNYFTREHKSIPRIRLNPKDQKASQDNNLESQAQVPTTGEFNVEKESRLENLKRNRSVDLNLKLPNIEYAESSVELDGDIVTKNDQKEKFNIQSQQFKGKHLGRLFKGFELTNISKELAVNDSPYSKHLEEKSPLVKKKLKEFKFTQ